MAKNKSLKEIIAETNTQLVTNKQASVEVQDVVTDVAVLLTKTAKNLRDTQLVVSYEDLNKYLESK